MRCKTSVPVQVSYHMFCLQDRQKLLRQLENRDQAYCRIAAQGLWPQSVGRKNRFLMQTK